MRICLTFSLSLLIFFFITFGSSIGAEKYRVFFKDKGEELLQNTDELYSKALASVSARSILRRSKVLAPDSIVNYEDVPICSEYVNRIAGLGAKVLLELKWLNCVVIEAEETVVKKIRQLPFVKQVQKTGEKVAKGLVFENDLASQKNSSFQNILLSSETKSNYGNSFNQLEMLNIPFLHSLGITGDSVIIGVIDTGFRWKVHNAFRGINVLAEYDFLNQDTITANETQDTTIQDLHGSMVLSVLAGKSYGNLIGSAPNSIFVLAKTEDLRREVRFEEDCFARAVEWMDSIGVDIITSSLGYLNFDSTDISYTYNDLDGKTTLTSIYANKAFERGIVMVTAVGNKGPNPMTLQTPSDAFGEIAIGAVDLTKDTVLKFSSRGPTADGRIKPDVCALGADVYSGVNDSADKYVYGKGTSMATPLVAGGIALLLSTFEELTPQKTREIVLANSSMASVPNNDIGYGVPDFAKTALEYGIIISPPIYYYFLNRQRVVFSVISKDNIEFVKINYKPVGSYDYKSGFMRLFGNASQYYFDFYEIDFVDSTLEFFVEAHTLNGKSRRKPYFTNQNYVLRLGSKSANFDFVNLSEPFSYAEDGFTPENAIKVYPFRNANQLQLVIEIVEDLSAGCFIELYDLLGNIVSRQCFEATSSNYCRLEMTFDNISEGIFIFKASFPRVARNYTKILYTF